MYAQSGTKSPGEWQLRGDSLLEIGEFTEAIAAFSAAQEGFFGEKDVENAVSSALGRSIGHLFSGAPAQAREVLLAARDSALAHIPEKLDLLANIYGLLGTVYNFLGDNEKALEVSLEAVRVKQQIPNLEPDELPYNYHNIGAIYFARNDFEHAIEYEKAARKGYKAVGMEQDYAATGINLGIALIRKGAYAEALEVLTESAQLVDPAQLETVQLAAMYIHLGLANQELKKWKASEAAFSQALALPDLRPSLAGIAEGNLGLTYLLQGRHSQAQSALAQGVAHLQSSPNPDRDDLAKLLLHQGQAQRAVGQVATAQATYAQGIRTILDLPPKANPDTLRHFQRPCNLRTLMRLFAARARAYQAAGQPAKALAAFQQANQVIDQLRRSFFGEGSKEFWAAYVLPIYEQSLGLACDRYQATGDAAYFDLASELAERNKAVLLLESMQEAIARKAAGLPDSLLQEVGAVRRAIAYYEKALYDAENAGDSSRISLYSDYLIAKQAESDRLESRMQREMHGYLRMEQAAAPQEEGALRRLAEREQATVVEYFVGDSSLFALVASTSGMAVHRLQLPQDFAVQVAAFRRSLSDWQYIMSASQSAWTAYVEGAHAFYQMLLAPLFGEALPPRLLVIPDGLLAYLPFEAFLKEAAGEPGSYLGLPYLLHECEVSYAYSAALLQERAMPAASPGEGGLAFSPAYQGSEMAEGLTVRGEEVALPGAEAEMQAVAMHFPTATFVGQAATEARFKASAKEYSIVHLAMHGILNDAHAAFSYLAFGEGGAETEDGALYAYELEQMEIPADLVVLSACETGTGELVRGEGVRSLARGFLQAGAAAVIMSLWKLEDRSTSQLVDELYRELAEGNRKSAALRRAKQAYLGAADDFTAHPGFWAGFVLIGENAPLAVEKGRAWLWILGSCLAVFALWVGVRNLRAAGK